MKPYGIKYLVSYHSAMYGLIEEDAGVLYVLNMLTGNVFWFDNDNLEWHKSLYLAKDLEKDIGTEFEEVEDFDNGYVNTDILWEQGLLTNLIGLFKEEFTKNLSLQEQIEV